MKITHKTRVSVWRLCKIIFFFVLTIVIFCACDTTEDKRTDTDSVANINITKTIEKDTTAATTVTTTNITIILTTSSRTTTTTTEQTTTTTKTTTVQKSTTELIETVPMIEESSVSASEESVSSEQFIGTFSRGTFYTTGSYGGSGRTLVSGYSIASRAIYETYGYGDYKIRIECEDFPALNGIYSLDDCSAQGNYEVIDFWFAPNDVPSYFRQMGVFEVKAYIVY